MRRSILLPLARASPQRASLAPYHLPSTAPHFTSHAYIPHLPCGCLPPCRYGDVHVRLEETPHVTGAAAMWAFSPHMARVGAWAGAPWRTRGRHVSACAQACTHVPASHGSQAGAGWLC